jgi:hypothetical protein
MDTDKPACMSNNMSLLRSSNDLLLGYKHAIPNGIF